MYKFKILKDRMHKVIFTRSTLVHNAIHRETLYRRKLIECKSLYNLLFIEIKIQVRIRFLTFHDVIKCRFKSKDLSLLVRVIRIDSRHKELNIFN